MRKRKYKNLKETCVVLNRTSATIYSWIKRGCPHYVDDFGRRYFDPDEVRQWVKENIKLKHVGDRASEF